MYFGDKHGSMKDFCILSLFERNVALKIWIGKEVYSFQFNIYWGDKSKLGDFGLENEIPIETKLRLELLCP